MKTSSSIRTTSITKHSVDLSDKEIELAIKEWTIRNVEQFKLIAPPDLEVDFDLYGGDSFVRGATVKSHTEVSS